MYFFVASQIFFLVLASDSHRRLFHSFVVQCPEVQKGPETLHSFTAKLLSKTVVERHIFLNLFQMSPLLYEELGVVMRVRMIMY